MALYHPGSLALRHLRIRSVLPLSTPFLPQTNADGQEVYSCRIGGPRIYDLLNELSLDEFGLMSWAIVDREEELFEMDDVRDEDKVMLALWNRWIMLHK